MGYLLWNIDDADINTTFTQSQLQNVDVIEMINLHIRGGDSTYMLPMDMPAGKTLTIYNRTFGKSVTGNYYGVKFLLKANQTEEKSSYWFFFEGQSATFFFNGKEWILQDPWPNTRNIELNWKKDLTRYGLLNIQDYTDSKKQLLFSNLDMSGMPQNLDGCFFKHGDVEQVCQVKEGVFKEHGHITEPHKHTYFINKTRTCDVLDDLNYILVIQAHKGNNWWMFGQLLTEHNPAISWAMRVIGHWAGAGGNAFDTDELALRATEISSMKPFEGNSNMLKAGGEETRPKSINGNFVIRGY